MAGLLILPCFSVSPLNGYDEKRLFVILVLALTLAVCIIWFQQKENLRLFISRLPGRAWMAVGGFFLMGGISAWLSVSRAHAFIEVLHLAGLTVLILSLAALYDGHPRFFARAVMVTLFGFASIYVFQVLVEYGLHFTADNHPLWPHRSRFVLQFDGETVAGGNNIGFENIRFFNHVQTWTLPLMVAGAGMLPRKWWAAKQVANGVLAFWWMLVFASAARGTAIGLLLSAGLIWLFFGKHAHRYLRRFGLTLILGALLYLVLYKWIPAEAEGMKSIVRSNPSNRWDYWSNAFRLFKEHWLLGIGPMHYAHVGYKTSVAAPHNMYLQMLAEWGIAGFGFLAWIGISGYTRWITTIRKRISKYTTPAMSLRLGLTAAVTAALLHAFVSGIMNSPLSQLWGALIIGWMIGQYRKDKITSDKSFDVRIKPRYMIFAKVFLLFIMISYGYLLYPQIKDVQNRTEKYRQHVDTHIVYPRFWNQGKFGFE